jgi:hypothetical protein
LQLRLHAGQQLGNTHQHGDMAIVPAGVHDADFLAVERSALLRREGQIDLLGDRQRIHVRPQRNHRSGFSGIQQPDHAGMGNTGLYCQPECSQMPGDRACRANLAIR